MREQGFWTHKDYNPLPKAERNALAIKASQGDQDAKDKLIKSHIRLAVKQSTRWAKKYPSASIDDLIQEACIGLIDASNKINTDRGAFTTCATLYIDKRLADFCGSDTLIRVPLTARWKHHSRTEETIRLAQIATKNPLSFDFFDLAYEEDNDIRIDQETQLQEIKSAMRFLTNHERTIMDEKYLSGIDYENNVLLAEKFHSSRQNIAQAVLRATGKLREAIRDPYGFKKQFESNPKNIHIGRSFHHWTVIGNSDKRNKKGHKAYCLCECKCGTTKEIKKSKLLMMLSRSCGCDRKNLILASRNAKNLSARS